MVTLFDIQIAYVQAFQQFYRSTRRIPIWYITHHEKHSNKFSKMYSMFIQYSMLKNIETIQEFFLYTFAVADSPPSPEKLGEFIYIGDFLKNGRSYGKDLRLVYFS